MSPPHPVVTVETAARPGPFLIVCEHASNAFPAGFGTLGLTVTQRLAHIAWDPGALALSRGLLDRLGGRLVAAEVSRLIYDCNRPPEAPGAMAAKTEMHEVPGNAGLSPEARRQRTEAVYVPFTATVHAEIARALALGAPPVLVTIHSFTPTWFGTPRAVELGIIHDADPRLALAVLAAARAEGSLNAALNEPYSAADGVTHSLRLHALPYGLDNVMLEIRNDLIAAPQAVGAMADKLAGILSQALAALASLAPSQARSAP